VGVEGGGRSVAGLLRGGGLAWVTTLEGVGHTTGCSTWRRRAVDDPARTSLLDASVAVALRTGIHFGKHALQVEAKVECMLGTPRYLTSRGYIQ
jgi:hypothetical protein